jgi:PAS domain S-box-containing protein
MGLLGALTRVWKTGRPELLPVREYQDQRITLWVENYIYRLPSGEIVAIYEDITARKQAEEALARSEERYRSLATTADLMYLADREGRCLFLNDGYMKRIGLPKEQIIGRFYSDFHDEDATRMFMDSVQKVFDTEDVYQREHTSTRDGKIFLITYSPVKDSLGQTRAVTIVSKDITERKKAENALRASREQLRAFAGRLQATREEERTQIAREIHDELGGALTAMKIDSSLLARTVAKVRDKALKNSLQARIDEMTKLIDATTQNMRRIATGLRPGILDDLGLVAALEWQLTDFQKRTGVRCEFTPSADCADLDQNRATALFRMAQEALTNVARHAQATEVRVRLQENAGTILLEVEDNGVGIKAEEIRNTKSLGILGMRERALAFGGRVTITGRPGEGTTVAVESPPAGRGVQDREGDE